MNLSHDCRTKFASRNSAGPKPDWSMRGQRSVWQFHGSMYGVDPFPGPWNHGTHPLRLALRPKSSNKLKIHNFCQSMITLVRSLRIPVMLLAETVPPCAYMRARNACGYSRGVTRCWRHGLREPWVTPEMVPPFPMLPLQLQQLGNLAPR